jgi:hypothetical protein
MKSGRKFRTMRILAEHRGTSFALLFAARSTSHGINLAVRGQQRYGLTHLGASCCAVRLVSTRHLMIDPSVRLVHLVADLVDELA